MKRNIYIAKGLVLSKTQLRISTIAVEEKSYPFHVYQDDMYNYYIEEWNSESDTFVEINFDDDEIELTPLALLLKLKDVSGYRLATLSGIPQSTISRFVTGETQISKAEFQTAVQIADALEMTIDELWKALH